MRGLVVVAVTAGCWTDSSTPPKAPEPTPVAAVEPVTAPAPAPSKPDNVLNGQMTPEAKAQLDDALAHAHTGGPGVGSVGPVAEPIANGPKVRVGEPVGASAMPQDVIRHVVHEHLRQLSACYESALEANPKLAGAVRVRFTIGPDGRVVQSHGEGLQGKVDDCIATVISTARFPPPPNGATIVVEYPFNFTP